MNSRETLREKQFIEELGKLGNKDVRDGALEALRTAAAHPRGKVEAVIFLNHVLSTRKDEAPFVRAASMTILGILISSQAFQCCLHESMYFNKLIAYLKARCMDADGACSEASADVMAILLKRLHDSRETAALQSQNLLLDLILWLLSHQGKESQASACLALTKVVPYIDELGTERWAIALRLLNLSSYANKTGLIQALATSRVEDCSVSGLILLPEALEQSILDQIIGQDPEFGLLGNACNVAEWTVRAAAVRGLKAVCIRAGLRIKAEQEGVIIGLLNKVKHDKVKPVRLASADALAVYMELQEFKAGGEQSWADWQEHCSTRVPAKGGQLTCARLTPPPGKGCPKGNNHCKISRTPRSTLRKNISKQFKESARKNNMVLEPSKPRTPHTENNNGSEGTPPAKSKVQMDSLGPAESDVGNNSLAPNSVRMETTRGVDNPLFVPAEKLTDTEDELCGSHATCLASAYSSKLDAASTATCVRLFTLETCEFNEQRQRMSQCGRESANGQSPFHSAERLEAVQLAGGSVSMNSSSDSMTFRERWVCERPQDLGLRGLNSPAQEERLQMQTSRCEGMQLPCTPQMRRRSSCSEHVVRMSHDGEQQQQLAKIFTELSSCKKSFEEKFSFMQSYLSQLGEEQEERMANLQQICADCIAKFA